MDGLTNRHTDKYTNAHTNGHTDRHISQKSHKAETNDYRTDQKKHPEKKFLPKITHIISKDLEGMVTSPRKHPKFPVQPKTIAGQSESE